MAEYKIHIEGFLPDAGRNNLPEKYGVYLVFRGVPDGEHGVDLKEIIYIGKADDETFNDRHFKREHERYQDFCDSCKEGETIFYAYIDIESSNQDIDIIENALVFAEQPKLNTQLKDHFQYGETTVHITGCSILQHTDYILIKDNIADIDEVDE